VKASSWPADASRAKVAICCEATWIDATFSSAIRSWSASRPPQTTFASSASSARPAKIDQKPIPLPPATCAFVVLIA
jgi:hypothetical protein